MPQRSIPLARLLLLLLVLLAAALLWREGKEEIPVADSEDEDEDEDLRSSHALLPCKAPRFSDDTSPASLERALLKSLEYYEAQRDDEELAFGEDTVTITKVKETIAAVLKGLRAHGLSKEFYQYLDEDFQWYKCETPSVLFTGYYLPSLKGSWSKSQEYAYPLYRKPENLCRVHLKDFDLFNRFEGLPEVFRGRLTKRNRVVPYYTREEIDYGKVLSGRGLELLWLDDPIDRFFLHVQGSGIVYLESGDEQRVNYADCSGHQYRSIGKYLIEQGVLTKESVSMKSIRDHLESNPEKQREILSHDPSYVFFRLVDDGPYGCLELPLTAKRSIATDMKVYPAAAVALIESQKPILEKGSAKIQKWQKFTRLVVNQDTGGAIRGARRVDIFCGHGEEAEIVAGEQKHPGSIYFFLKKSVP